MPSSMGPRTNSSAGSLTIDIPMAQPRGEVSLEIDSPRSAAFKLKHGSLRVLGLEVHTTGAARTQRPASSHRRRRRQTPNTYRRAPRHADWLVLDGEPVLDLHPDTLLLHHPLRLPSGHRCLPRHHLALARRPHVFEKEE